MASKYRRYVNYDAIHVESIADIPFDYYGAMTVPATFLSSHDTSDFEIIGTSTDCDGIEPIGREFIEKYFADGNTGHYTPNMRILGYYDEEGRAVIPYKRILV